MMRQQQLDLTTGITICIDKKDLALDDIGMKVVADRLKMDLENHRYVVSAIARWEVNGNWYLAVKLPKVADGTTERKPHGRSNS